MARQTGRYVLWTPVAFIAGIGSYFGLPIEPAWPVFAFGGFVAVLVLALRLRMHVPFVLLMIGVMAAGFVTARLRAVLVAPRVLAASTGSVEISGWIDRMEMTSPRRARYYIHLTNAKGIRPDALPDLIRISGKKPPKPLVYGDTITAKARLFSLPTPVTPGGFDFGRRLWFQSVGATGFVFGNITLTGKRPLSWSDKLIAGVQRLRQTMGVYIQAALPGQTGAIATALITGERGGIDRKTRDLLQTAGLAH
ncbi:MAG TPA: DUF4131 domain-containing protein, partial [Rhizobiales bacterium]|nr:DUF4131 domain-containing protein [Hyphomicrobiales bacterium]